MSNKPNNDHALRWNKHRLTAPLANNGTKNPTLAVDLFENNPRIIVSTGVENDKNWGRIEGKMDMIAFAQLMEAIILVARDTSGNTSFKINNQAHLFINGKRSEKPLTESFTLVNRDENGVYIALIAYDKERPAIRFYFGPQLYHPISDAKGNEIPKATLSAACAVAYAKSMLQMTLIAQNRVYESYNSIQARKEAAKGNSGGGNGGNYNNRNNNNNNSKQQQPQQQSSSAVSVDDIPW